MSRETRGTGTDLLDEKIFGPTNRESGTWACEDEYEWCDAVRDGTRHLLYAGGNPIPLAVVVIENPRSGKEIVRINQGSAVRRVTVVSAGA